MNSLYGSSGPLFFFSSLPFNDLQCLPKGGGANSWCEEGVSQLLACSPLWRGSVSRISSAEGRGQLILILAVHLRGSEEAFRSNTAPLTHHNACSPTLNCFLFSLHSGSFQGAILLVPKCAKNVLFKRPSMLCCFGHECRRKIDMLTVKKVTN